jgi:hypothetical protein
MANVERRNEFIRLINVGLSKDYIWSDFAYGWVEEDWPEQSAEVKAQVTSWVRQYADSLQYVELTGTQRRVSNTPRDMRLRPGRAAAPLAPAAPGPVAFVSHCAG